ncbi:hypothetical protein DPQ31_28105 [Bacillus sp. COPE52]|nr:hypothetical protein DPQ31_28105 [Bacillus sp. COPE52]
MQKIKEQPVKANCSSPRGNGENIMLSALLTEYLVLFNVRFRFKLKSQQLILSFLQETSV